MTFVINTAILDVARFRIADDAVTHPAVTATTNNLSAAIASPINRSGTFKTPQVLRPDAFEPQTLTPPTLNPTPYTETLNRPTLNPEA